MTDFKWKKMIMLLAGIVGSTVVQAQTPAVLSHDAGVGANDFGGGELKAALVRNGHSVTDLPLGDLSRTTQSVRTILTTSEVSMPGKPPFSGLPAQGHAIQRVTAGAATNWWVIGHDPAGARYGGLEFAEAAGFTSMSSPGTSSCRGREIAGTV